MSNVARLLSSSFGVQFSTACRTPEAPKRSCSFIGSLNLGSREKEAKDAVHLNILVKGKAFTVCDGKGPTLVLAGSLMCRWAGASGAAASLGWRLLERVPASVCGAAGSLSCLRDPVEWRLCNHME